MGGDGGELTMTRLAERGKGGKAVSGARRTCPVATFVSAVRGTGRLHFDGSRA